VRHVVSSANTVPVLAAVAAIGGLFLAGCTQGAPTQPTRSERMVSQAHQLERLRKVNDNWNADCTTDAVTGVRECFAGTFGQSMDNRGNAFGPQNMSLRVYFLDGNGPYLSVGTNTYPGRTLTIRLDDGEPVNVRPMDHQPDVVSTIMDAQTARARFHVWPEGSRDMIVDLHGFSEAWSKLLEYVGGAAAPSEWVGRE
jgi:hypothetical protein